MTDDADLLRQIASLAEEICVLLRAHPPIGVAEAAADRDRWIDLEDRAIDLTEAIWSAQVTAYRIELVSRVETLAYATRVALDRAEEWLEFERIVGGPNP